MYLTSYEGHVLYLAVVVKPASLTVRSYSQYRFVPQTNDVRSAQQCCGSQDVCINGSNCVPSSSVSTCGGTVRITCLILSRSLSLQHFVDVRRSCPKHVLGATLGACSDDLDTLCLKVMHMIDDCV